MRSWSAGFGVVCLVVLHASRQASCGGYGDSRGSCPYSITGSPVRYYADPVVTDFWTNLTSPTTVNLEAINPILEQFPSVIDFTQLGRLGADLSTAVQYGPLKLSLSRIWNQVEGDLSNLGTWLNEMATAFDMQKLNTVPEGLRVNQENPLDADQAWMLLNHVLSAADYVVLGNTVQKISAGLDLNVLGSEISNAVSYIDLVKLGDLVARIPQVIDFPRAATLATQLSAEVNLPMVGTVLNDEVSWIGEYLACAT